MTEEQIQKLLKKIDNVEDIAIVQKDLIVSLKNTLNWMISDIDFRNRALIEKGIGLEMPGDTEQLKIARILLKGL